METLTRFSFTVLFCLVALPQVASAQLPEIHNKHFIFGYPSGAPATNDLIIRDLYALSSNDDTKFADWVAYRLTPNEVMGILDLQREWRADPFLDASETLEPDPASQDDYRRTDDNPHPYDRGHLAPLASFKGDRDASSVNFYSNIVPQVAAMNRGPWGDLEQAIRNIVCTGKTVWVMTGPLYEGTELALPLADEPHTVPSGFWKIVVGAEGGGLWVASFAFNQDTPRDADIEDHLVSVDDLETRTGLDFLRELPDGEEAVIEGTALLPPEWDQILPDRSCPPPVR